MISGTNIVREAKDGWLATKDGMYDVSWAKLGPWPSGIASREVHLSCDLQYPAMSNADGLMVYYPRDSTSVSALLGVQRHPSRYSSPLNNSDLCFGGKKRGNIWK